MGTQSKSPKIPEATPQRPLLAVDLLQYSFVSPAIDLIHNSAAVGVLFFGLGLAKQDGIHLAFYNARNTAKVHAISSCFNCALNAALTNFTIFNGNLSVFSAGLAGCCTGFLRPFAFGSSYSNLSNCIKLTIPGLADFAYNSWHSFASKIPKSIFNFGTKLVRGDFVVKAMKLVLVTTTFVSIVANGVELELWKGAAPDVQEFSAIALSLLASSSLLLFGLHHKRNALSAGAAGCWTNLLIPQPYDGPKDVIYECFHAGLLLETFKAMYSRGSYFLRLPLIKSKVYDGGVLPPFTLLLPQEVEDGFSVFYNSLKKSIKKQQHL